MIMQMLVPGLGAGSVRSIVMKSGDQPAMKMPPQMIQMVILTRDEHGGHLARRVRRWRSWMGACHGSGGEFRALTCGMQGRRRCPRSGCSRTCNSRW